MLPHEHILVDFVGADGVSPDRYDADEAFKVMLPFVKQAKESGCATIAECTPLTSIWLSPGLAHGSGDPTVQPVTFVTTPEYIVSTS